MSVGHRIFSRLDGSRSRIAPRTNFESSPSRLYQLHPAFISLPNSICHVSRVLTQYTSKCLNALPAGSCTSATLLSVTEGRGYQYSSAAAAVTFTMRGQSVESPLNSSWQEQQSYSHVCRIQLNTTARDQRCVSYTPYTNISSAAVTLILRGKYSYGQHSQVSFHHNSAIIQHFGRHAKSATGGRPGRRQRPLVRYIN